MSWSGLAYNQMVSRANLQDAVDTGVLLLKSAIPITETNKEVKRSDAESYVYVNPNETTWDTYASNQLIPKNVYEGARVVAYTGQYSATSCAAACTSTDIRTIYTTGALNVGVYSFKDPALTIRADNGYYVIPELGYCYFLDQFKTLNGYCVSKTVNTFYTFDMYGKMGASGFPSDVKIQYSTASSGGPWVDAFTISSTSCPPTPDFTTSYCSGVQVWLQAVRTDNGDAVYFNTSTNSTCPSNTAVTCLPAITFTQNEIRSITIYVNAGDFLYC